VIYDWRLDGKAVAVSDRMHGRSGGVRKPLACPA
jgi:soluble lytic murein transglycosylase